MGLFGFGKKKAASSFPEDEMDVPPKPPEFRVEGPAGPTPDELAPPPELKPMPLPEPPLPRALPSIEPISAVEMKPVHIDDLSVPTEHPVELPMPEVQQAIAEVRRQVPGELPPLEIPDAPLTHSEYTITPEPALMRVAQPAYAGTHPFGDSVLIQTEGPLFLTLEGYEKVVGSIVRGRAALQQAEDRTVSMNASRNKEDALYTRFQQSVEHVERKLAYIDRMLFGETEE